MRIRSLEITGVIRGVGSGAGLSDTGVETGSSTSVFNFYSSEFLQRYANLLPNFDYGHVTGYYKDCTNFLIAYIEKLNRNRYISNK